ncbi:hypothetical protein MASR2M47_27380 [Draconibacterium sp.]|jgi:hypothetical protein
MKKFFKILGLAIILLFAGLVTWMFMNMRDRHPGYSADLSIANNSPSELKVGFAAVTITPEVPDRWVDANNDHEYNPKDGDTFTDGNGNGKFDPVWIAGFSNRKPANGVHDDTWARTMIVDDGLTRLAIVSIDAIGFMNDDVLDVRKLIAPEAGITYAIISSTHTHEGPDMIGMWSGTPFKDGLNKKYLKYVKTRIVQSVEAAVKNMQPARLEISQDLTGAIPLVKDTRKPEVFDSGMRMIKAIDKGSGEVLGSLVAWADHPETLWSQNLLVSSDFPHYVREGVEKGVFNGDTLMKPGIGGVCVYVNGAVGGLMTTHPSLPVFDPFTGVEYNEPTFEKTEAQGKQLSLLALNAMDNPTGIIESAGISMVVRTLPMKIDNIMFKLGAALGIMNRGTVSWMKMRSELAVVKIGPLSMVAIPGEIYPELVNGPIDAPEGNDFGIQALEIPPIREMMPGKYKFIVGLANDEIGYIIPKSQWDEKAPYTYGRDKSPYGEENSLGPNTANVIHSNLKEMLVELEK